MVQKTEKGTGKESIRKTSKKAGLLSVEETNTTSSQLSRLSQLIDFKNKKIGLATAVVLVLLTGFLFLNGLVIAAFVNGEPITRISIISQLEKQNGAKLLDNLIIKKLILQDANKQNITVNQSEIDSQLEKISANVKNQGSTLDKALMAQGMTKDDLVNEIRIQLLVEKLVEKNIKVTDKEINDFIEANKAQIPEGTSKEQLQQQAKAQITQQKLSEESQKLIENLKKKANILNLVKY